MQHLLNSFPVVTQIWSQMLGQKQNGYTAVMCFVRKRLQGGESSDFQTDVKEIVRFSGPIFHYVFIWIFVGTITACERAQDGDLAGKKVYKP
jgi:hypothetical protein